MVVDIRHFPEQLLPMLGVVRAITSPALLKMEKQGGCGASHITALAAAVKVIAGVVRRIKPSAVGRPRVAGLANSAASNPKHKQQQHDGPPQTTEPGFAGGQRSARRWQRHALRMAGKLVMTPAIPAALVPS
jgi:hypothetical protein